MFLNSWSNNMTFNYESASELVGMGTKCFLYNEEEGVRESVIGISIKFICVVYVRVFGLN